MFTGIVAAVGSIQSIQFKGGDVSLTIAAHDLDLSDVALGDSVAINGVCLTVTQLAKSSLCFDVSNESLKRTSLASVVVGTPVNIEKALAVGDRLGGHFVSGHIDGVGHIKARKKSGRSVQFVIEVPTALSRYIAEKGSISVDGVSLTINAVVNHTFFVNIIPHTIAQTIIGDYRVGTIVNLEVDLIVRYLERLLSEPETATITQDKLTRHGFMR